MIRIQTCAAVAISAFTAFGAVERTITLEEYRDKMKAAWIGQMVGVSWGAPTEFKWKDEIIPADKVPEWKSGLPRRHAYNNDDLYVEMTFLRTLELYGTEVSIRQAGIDFANSRYGLWAANDVGRNNLRRGVAPPDCSHPRYNGCANAIDYQIEADYSGIISPGCPQEAIRLGNIFGRLMNYGDGMWAGQFIGAMYSEAFFTSDVNAILDAGLAAIPAESDYAQMVRNVRKWHGESPSDWTVCWEKVRDAYSRKYNKSLRDPSDGLDVRLNGACIVVGLLYGEGDLDRAMVVSMRCGWDSDCNPSNVGGILFAARGFKALDAKYVKDLDYVKKFSFTDYNLPGLFAVCEKLARQIVVRNGGRVVKGADGAESFVIPVRKPVPDAFIPSWNAPAPAGARYSKEEMAGIKFPLPLPDPDLVRAPGATTRVRKAVEIMFPGWKTSANRKNVRSYGAAAARVGKDDRIASVHTHPVSAEEPFVLSRTMTLSAGKPALRLVCGTARRKTAGIAVRVNGEEIFSKEVKGSKYYTVLEDFTVPLDRFAGKEVKIELVNTLADMFWSVIEIKE